MATSRAGAKSLDMLKMKPGKEPVVTCYLKIEPRDRARKKYLTKVRNRVKELSYALPSLGWNKAQQEAIRLDFARIIDALSDPDRLPHTEGVAIFASAGRRLFQVHPLPRVHRSRLVVDRTPLVREFAATEEEFGRLFTVVLDRASALIWEVTADGAKVVRKISSEVTRGGKYHPEGRGGKGNWARGGSAGEHTYHNRIQNEKRRHLEAVARALFEEDRRNPGHQIVLAGAGNDAAALEPFIHSSVADRLIGLARLSPRDATPSAVHQLTMEVREAQARASENRHVGELKEGLGTGWAVNGVAATLHALNNGQVRTLLVHPEAAMGGFRSLRTGRLALVASDIGVDGDVVPVFDVIDDAIEEALRQRVALDVVYDESAAAVVDGLAALLRFI